MLNPLRNALARSGQHASNHDSPFASEAEAALAGFRAIKDDFQRQVHRHLLPPNVAREQPAQASSSLRQSLQERAENFSPVPRAFFDRLVEAARSRKQAREHASLESLQRETNRLLRQTLIEQQIVTRSP